MVHGLLLATTLCVGVILRSMARFGLLISNKGKWNTEEIINEPFINATTATSQNINLSYGYLWRLNGKAGYHLPQSEMLFTVSIISTAPSDMFMALGKNEQQIYITPRKYGRYPNGKCGK
jgi:hypothetical protein